MLFIYRDIRCEGLFKFISEKKSQPGKAEWRVRMKKSQGESKQRAGIDPGDGRKG